MTDDFYEPDEPPEDVAAASDAGELTVTVPYWTVTGATTPMAATYTIGTTYILPASVWLNGTGWRPGIWRRQERYER